MFGVTDVYPTLCETYVAKRNLDGGLEIEYKYDSGKDPNSPFFLYLKSEAEILPSVRSAKEEFNDRISAYKVGMSLAEGRAIDVDKSLFSLGEENYAGFVKQGETIIGNLIVTRKGMTVFSFIIYGLYFDDPELLQALLEPKMNKAK